MKINLASLWLAVGASLLSTASFADEPIHPRGWSVLHGFHPILLRSHREGNFSLPQDLHWPIQFEDGKHLIGNTMTQFQNYMGKPSASYYHGGCDLRTKEGEAIHATVSGMLQAGHYSYETNLDGSMYKFWKPWPQTGDPTYFEVAILTPDGFRFEFHHVNQKTLPAAILNKLKHGGGSVTAGEVLGYVIPWPIAAVDGTFYHHTHYNIIDPNGIRVNPEYASEPLADKDHVQLTGIYALNAAGQAREVHAGDSIPAAATEFVIAAVIRGENNVYTQAPAHVEMVFESGQKIGWDFRRGLVTSSGKFPDIREFYRSSLCLTPEKCLATKGDYNSNFFLVSIKRPALSGAFSFVISSARGEPLTVNARLE